MLNKQLFFRAYLVVIMILLEVLSVWATEASFTITTTSGTVAEFLIADNPIITYEDNLLVVKGGNLEINVSANEVSSFDFISSEAGVDEMKEEGFKLSRLTPGTQVEIYTLEGKCAAFFKANYSQSVKIELNKLSPGIYIVRTPITTFKIKIN